MKKLNVSLPLATVLAVALTMTAQTQALGREAGHPVPWVRLDGFTQAAGSAKGEGGNVFALTLKSNAMSLTRSFGLSDVSVDCSVASDLAR